MLLGSVLDLEWVGGRRVDLGEYLFARQWIIRDEHFADGAILGLFDPMPR